MRDNITTYQLILPEVKFAPTISVIHTDYVLLNFYAYYL